MLYRRRPPPITDRAIPGHNGGPPLEDPPHRPEWGECEPIGYFTWKAAAERAWKNIPREIVLMRMRRATALGLTYREYTLEILERGRHLGPEDQDRIAAIIRARET